MKVIKQNTNLWLTSIFISCIIALVLLGPQQLRAQKNKSKKASTGITREETLENQASQLMKMVVAEIRSANSVKNWVNSKTISKEEKLFRRRNFSQYINKEFPKVVQFKNQILVPHSTEKRADLFTVKIKNKRVQLLVNRQEISKRPGENLNAWYRRISRLNVDKKKKSTKNAFLNFFFNEAEAQSSNVDFSVQENDFWTTQLGDPIMGRFIAGAVIAQGGSIPTGATMLDGTTEQRNLMTEVEALTENFNLTCRGRTAEFQFEFDEISPPPYLIRSAINFDGKGAALEFYKRQQSPTPFYNHVVDVNLIAKNGLMLTESIGPFNGKKIQLPEGEPLINFSSQYSAMTALYGMLTHNPRPRYLPSMFQMDLDSIQTMADIGRSYCLYKDLDPKNDQTSDDKKRATEL